MVTLTPAEVRENNHPCKAYERMAFAENLSWCKPLSFDDGKVVIALNEGEIAGAVIDGEVLSNLDVSVCSIARRCNPDYDGYTGFSDLDILLQAPHVELGCASCPFRDECDAMDNED